MENIQNDKSNLAEPGKRKGGLIARLAGIPQALLPRFTRREIPAANPTILEPKHSTFSDPIRNEPRRVGPSRERHTAKPQIAVPAAKSPHLSRAQRMATYAAGKEGRTVLEQPGQKGKERPNASSAARAQTEQLTPSVLPPGVREIRNSEQHLILHQSEDEIPWLDKQEVVVPLKEVTLQSSSRERFLYGVCMENRKLQDVFGAMTVKQRESADDALFVQMAELIQRNYAPHMKLLKNPRGKRPILYTGNKAGQRVYIIRFGQINNIPVIIRIAACDKNMQDEALAVISTEERRYIKKVGKL